MERCTESCPQRPVLGPLNKILGMIKGDFKERSKEIHVVAIIQKVWLDLAWNHLELEYCSRYGAQPLLLITIMNYLCSL